MPDNVPATVPATVPTTLNLGLLIERILGNPDFPADTIERMARLALEFIKEQQRAECYNALALVQADIQPVFRSRKNLYLGNTYATLDDVMTMLGPILGRHGITVNFAEIEGAPENHIRMGMTVSKGGYSIPVFKDITRTVAGARGGTTQMTAQQQAGAVGTYAKRYLLIDFFNISTTDVDDDGEIGREPPPKPAETKQQPSAAQQNLEAALRRPTPPQQATGAATVGKDNGQPSDPAPWLARLKTLLMGCKSLDDVNAIRQRPAIATWTAGASLEVKAEILALFTEAVERLAPAAAGTAPADPAPVSPGLAGLLARIAGCDQAALDALPSVPSFNETLITLTFPEQDRVDEAIKARAAELAKN